jgi:hypothetical protein
MIDPRAPSADSSDFLSEISSLFSTGRFGKPLVWVAYPRSALPPALTSVELERVTRFREHLGPDPVRSAKRNLSDRVLLALWAALGEPEQWHWSISHSGDWVLGVGDHAPVGVDLEPEQRELSPRALERLLSSKERAEGFASVGEGIPLWCLKEATFKATPKNLGRVLTDFKLNKFTPSDGRALLEDAKTSRLWLGQVAKVAGYWIAVVRPASQG